MKKIFALLVLVVLTVASVHVKAQMSTGVDLYSSYVWRGAKFGTGPAIQPWVDYTTGGLSIGAWGSVCTSSDEALEMDLYAGYSFDFGLGITVTDYYFGDGWLTSESHFLEPSLSYEVGGLSLSAAYMLGMGDDETADMYIEAGYSFDSFDIFVGAGDGQYTATDDDPDGGFNLCNIGIGTSKDIKITEDFSLPVSGSVILNPATEGFFIVVGISL